VKVAIIGGGLIGVTTAYFMSNAGHDVTVIDREAGPGRGTSFANGALITPGMAEPWNTPGVLRALLASIGKPDAAIRLQVRALPSMLGWGLLFLRNANLTAFEQSTAVCRRLALRSIEVLRAIREHTGIEFGHVSNGTLRLFHDAASLDTAWTAGVRAQRDGLRLRRLLRSEIAAVEPGLAPVAERFAGAIHYESDENGDAHQFCVALAEYASRQGVKFHFGTEVSSLQVRGRKIASLSTTRGTLVADRYIVAAGSYSAPLLRTAGLRLPVYPVKGYSITVSHPAGGRPIGLPIVDDYAHAVVTPLEGAIRVAGTAEFAGYDVRLDPSRIRMLFQLLKEVLPQTRFDDSDVRPWCGLRPVSADGVPIIGATSIPNLMVNAGHGHLGWTMAAGSAQLLADLMCDNPPGLEPSLYSPNRFAQ